MSLIDDLIKGGYLKTLRIIAAFREIRRQDFIVSGSLAEAEINAPIPIGRGQTISQPLTVAFMLELLKPQAGDKILDVGSGSGWTTTLLAHIVGERGKVYAVELLPELKTFGESNAGKYNFIKKDIARFFCADGRRGLPEYAPFDKILVSAASVTVPKNLLDQLKAGGRLVIPVGREHEIQDIVLIKRSLDNEINEERYPGFVFVPLG